MGKAREIAQTEVGVEAGLVLKIMEENQSCHGLSFEELVEAIKGLISSSWHRRH
jgi:hypothetical protein